MSVVPAAAVEGVGGGLRANPALLRVPSFAPTRAASLENGGGGWKGDDTAKKPFCSLGQQLLIEQLNAGLLFSVIDAAMNEAGRGS